MADHGDRKEDSTLDFTFTTISSTGGPTALSGSPAVKVFKGNSTTPSTQGITLDADFANSTGLNHVRVDTSADAFYAVANDYHVVITAGTVDSVSVIGYTVGSFSIENRYEGLHKIVESQGSYTAQQALSIILSACAGESTNSGATLKSPNGSATRITATVDSGDNRTAITLNPSTG